MISIFKKYYSEILLIFLLVIVIASSLPVLTTKPRLWFDEGINIEFAKNFLDFGQLDISIAPGEFSGLARFYQASGYLLQLPLSLVFWLFGFGPVQARAYMLGWMIAALIIVFIFVKKLVGRESALIATALIATFSSFHDNGRTVMGEIPGFISLLGALYLILWKKSYFASGLFFGLAIATKPSVYILVLPAILVLLVLEKVNFWKNGLKILAGMLPLFLLRIWFVMPDFFSLAAWKEVINLFQNPFGGNISQVTYFFNNLLAIPRTYTILYFGLFTLIILLDYFRRAEKDTIYKNFFSFAITYNFFAFLYYLKSPGWLRYLIAADFLTFILLVIALKNLLSDKKKALFYLAVVGLIGFQTFHLFTAAKIFYSDSEEAVMNLINTEFKNNTIGIFNVPEIGAFVPADRKYQAYRVVGLPLLGKNPILYDPPPAILITRSSENGGGMSLDEAQVLLEKYQFLRTVGRYDIYLETAKFDNIRF